MKVSKKSIYGSLLMAGLSVSAFAPVTALADDGIAKNDTVLTQPKTTERAVTAPSDGDLARSNEENTSPSTEVTTQPAVVPTKPAEDPTVADPTTEPSEATPDFVPANTENTDVAPQDPEVPSVNINGQPVVTVTPAAPVVTASGQTVISTQDSQVLVANPDGTSTFVAPEVAGLTVNADGTLTGKNDKGQEVTLPKTGETSTVFLSFVGSLMLALVAFEAVKKKA